MDVNETRRFLCNLNVQIEFLDDGDIYVAKLVFYNTLPQ